MGVSVTMRYVASMRTHNVGLVTRAIYVALVRASGPLFFFPALIFFFGSFFALRAFLPSLSSLPVVLRAVITANWNLDHFPSYHCVAALQRRSADAMEFLLKGEPTSSFIRSNGQHLSASALKIPYS